MNTSALYPPNHRSFSDGVIRDVIQRERHTHEVVADQEAHTTPFVRPGATGRTALPSIIRDVIQRERHTHEVVTDREAHTTPFVRPRATGRTALPSIIHAANISGRKRVLQAAPKSEHVHYKAQKTPVALSEAELEQKIAADLELRRERNRMHQARYKMKQRKLLADLEESIQHLQKDIQELEVQYRLVSYSVPTTSTIWGVTAEYFRLFRHGVKVPITTLPHTSQYQAQCDFIQATMALDVTDGMVFGVKAVMNNLQLQSRCYQEIDTYPVRLDNGPGDSLLATTRSVLTITEGTLTYGFPHLVHDLSSLAARMLGKQVTLHGSVHFVWDAARGRVTQLHWRADLLAAVLGLLGNLEDVERVFDGARISPDGKVTE